MQESRPPQQRGLSDALRAAVEDTLSSIRGRGAASAGELRAETIGRAGELLDEVARRGRGARSEIARRGEEAGAEIARRGQEARDASAAITAKLVQAIAETLRGDSKPKVDGE